jgi:hypothetical protein
VAGRLWDVAPDGSSQTLVARGEYRPKGSGDEVWQLHANGWRFAAGHVAKLELLGSDPPSSRPSNGTFEVTVERLELRLPVRERPGGVVEPKAPPVIPAGQTPVPSAAGTPRPRPRARLRLRLRCTSRGTRATATVTGGRARRVDFSSGGRLVARDTRPPFTRLFRNRHRIRIAATAAIRGAPSLRAVRSAPGCRPRRSAQFAG